MDGDKAICVRMEQGDAKSVQIISLQTGTVTSKFPMAAESAILSPDGKTIAVRGELAAVFTAREGGINTAGIGRLGSQPRRRMISLSTCL